MTNYVRKLLTDAEDAGFKIVVRCDGEIDYSGFHAAAAEEAVTAVDEAIIILSEGNGARRGTALIVNGLAEDERIADTSGSGWIEDWWQKNLGELV